MSKRATTRTFGPLVTLCILLSTAASASCDNNGIQPHYEDISYIAAELDIDSSTGYANYHASIQVGTRTNMVSLTMTLQRSSDLTSWSEANLGVLPGDKLQD